MRAILPERFFSLCLRSNRSTEQETAVREFFPDRCFLLMINRNLCSTGTCFLYLRFLIHTFHCRVDFMKGLFQDRKQ